MFKFIKRHVREGKNLVAFTGVRTFGEILVPLLIAKLFTSDLYGKFSLAKLIVFFYLTVFISSTRNAYIVFSNQEKTISGKINKTFSVQCVFILLGVTVFLASIFPLSGCFVNFAGMDYSFLPYMIIAFLGLSLRSFFCTTFLALGQRIKYSLSELVFGLGNLACIGFFYFFSEINLKLIFLSYALSAAILFSVFVWFVDWKAALPFHLERKQFLDMLHFIKWVFVGVTAIYFLNWGDNLILLHYKVGWGNIGIYNFAYTLFKGILVVIAAMNTYFLPFVSEHLDNKEKIREYLFKKRAKLLLIGLAGLCLAFIALPYFTDFFGETYKGSATVTRILLIAASMSFYSAFYQPLIMAKRKSRVNQSINIIQVFVNISLDLVLVPHFGILGAAIATSIGYTLQAILFELYYRLVLKKALHLKA
ncbi:MAG: polysaccharide biosynthesis C-terminal domain-containing protein [Sedimentisphaerales bacterium]|nr:polysaccharide biosynthesis C-terminal domain-containing protein [Sedimentisphaerales bacterium]